MTLMFLIIAKALSARIKELNYYVEQKTNGFTRHLWYTLVKALNNETYIIILTDLMLVN